MRGEVHGWNCRIWAKNHFFNIRLGIGARIKRAFMISCIYKSERTLALSFIYSRSLSNMLRLIIILFEAAKIHININFYNTNINLLFINLLYKFYKKVII